MDARSRSFNLIRAKIVSLWRERSWRMLGVVSATPEVGKSFVSANLAAALSRDPRFQTYLVDLDLRRGAVKDIFGLDVERGIAGLLQESGQISPLPALKPDGEELIIIPSVPDDMASAELLAGPRAATMLRAMRSSDAKNFFLFDLPPVFANDDAATVLEFLDGYIVVVEDGKTTPREIGSTVDMLGHEKLAGLVLNKYRGGQISEGRGTEERYASRYYSAEASAE
jgi:Mrp family chromosome partitioning ATPase